MISDVVTNICTHNSSESHFTLYTNVSDALPFTLTRYGECEELSMKGREQIRL